MTAMLQLCFVLLIPFVFCDSQTQLLETCSSCGPECKSSCGSRNFRTCCYNYLKKRSPIPPLPALSPILQQDSILRSKSPWLSTLLDGPASPRNSPVLGADRDLQVQLLLLPDWLTSDSLNHNRDYNTHYQENPPIGRLVGLDTQPTETPRTNGPNDADTSGENSEPNQATREHDPRGQNQRRHQPYHWNPQNQRQRENFAWGDVNRRLPVYGA